MQSVSLAIPHFMQEKSYSCVAACVRMLLDYYGINASEDEVRRLLGTKVTGTRFANVARTVSWWNLNLELGAFNISQLQAGITSGVAPIVFVQTGLLDYWAGIDVPHAVILTNIDDSASIVEVNDPSFLAPQQTSITIFDGAWQQTGYLAAFLRHR
jgi:ABC-type bacteriocin/lantibiotic exporter with double-glycine peptidase domain